MYATYLCVPLERFRATMSNRCLSRELWQEFYQIVGFYSSLTSVVKALWLDADQLGLRVCKGDEYKTLSNCVAYRWKVVSGAVVGQGG